MSTPNTASNYITLINQNYPIPGQDNNSQGFRNNFSNIKQALSWLDTDVYDLQLNGVKKTQNNNFNDNLIERATFKDCATKVYDVTAASISGDVEVDYENGNYQKFKITSGLHTFTFVNWPDSLKTGRVTLQIVSDSFSGASITFASYQVNIIGPLGLPLEVGTTPLIFDVWNDGDSGTIFVQYSKNVATSGILSSDTLILGTNVYTTVTNSSAKYATSVKANGKAGNLALVPNKIIGTITSTAVPVNPGGTTSNQLKINSTNGILNGATFDLPGALSAVKYTVVSTTVDTVTVNPAFQVAEINVNDVITFVNPTFTDQPYVVTFKSTAQTTTTSAVNDLKGTIYANSSSLYVSYSDFNYNSTSWIKLTGDHLPKDLLNGSTAVTQTTTDNSTLISTTAFVQNNVLPVKTSVTNVTNTVNSINSTLAPMVGYTVPAGGIILWSGSAAAIPAGWVLCNGANGTPDLRNRFVVGAGSTYAVNATGGSADAVVVSHTHSASTAIADPGHQHVSPTADCGTAAFGTNGTITDVFCDSNGNAAAGWLTSSASTGIDAETTISSTGESGTGKNLPPYYALCYIMKT